MKTNYITIILLLTLLSTFSLSAQQISKEELIFLTPEWKGERYPDGRPKVPDALLDRMKRVTLEEAWAVLRNENYKYQFDDGWQTVNPDSVLVGRAVTATFMPGRPDIHRVIDDRGHNRDKRVKSQNSWPIDMLKPGDVYVADGFGKIVDGTLIGDNLGNSIYAKSKNGVVFYGSVRDPEGLSKIDGFNVWVKGFDHICNLKFCAGIRHDEVDVAGARTDQRVYITQ